MNRVDGVILGVGVVVLVASIMGVVFYDESGGTTYIVNWNEGDADTLDPQTDSGAADTYEFEVPVNGTSLAQVSFEAEVSTGDPNVNDDTVDVAVEGPTDESGDCSFDIAASGDGSGSCTADATVNEEPERMEVEASNQTAARETALEQAASSNGTGTWTVTVTIDGGTEVSEPSYDITVTPSVVEWEPAPQRPGDQQGPG